ncbi:MAG: family 78 glycoside hydrolase catalytic domain [Clostridia bacterium]|nr:family 78 glycoside hydrolase catalytic domain [Clostridia bacterium]MBQ9996632.1 family 78 glycoside hydrolase catalytic domain [Clostridia bacterium]
MIQVTALYLDGAKIGEGSRKCISDTDTPTFSWAVRSDKENDLQRAFRVIVFDDKNLYWDSGTVKKSAQSVKYAGAKLPHGTRIDVSVTVLGTAGEQSQPYITSFVNGVLDETEISGSWITSAEPNEGRAIYFCRDFDLASEVASACLYVAGYGYHSVTVNGIDADDSLLEPAHSNYAKISYYTVHHDAARLFNGTHNTIGITVADGWRNNTTPLVENALGGRKVEFAGEPVLWAMLKITYTDGKTETVSTDGTWQYKFGAITASSIFNGETYDAARSDPDWNTGDMRGFTPAKLTDAPGGKLRPMVLEPIRIQKEYPAIEITRPSADRFVIDFGQNISGVVRMVLPETMTMGQTITIRHAEELDEDGNLFTAPLRDAKCTDTYIASGDSRDLFIWQPQFTYHGFRYAEVTGVKFLDKRDVTAVMFCTDIKNGSFFRCGSALANKIQENIVMTEMDNMHSILTDCPQRDERMGWMNDATVRFEETPYNFDIGRMFPKIVRDIMAEQRENGEFTCCCPFVFGGLPADPVCSSFLTAGMQAYMHTGNLELLREAYDRFAAWEDYLLSRSDNYIVNYSYYGDWAAPSYACVAEENAYNKETEGILMSTGYSYFNCKTLAKMARALHRTDDAFKYIDLAIKVGKAFLAKWWHPETATVGTGSQGAQAFALWLGLVPGEYEQKAAAVMCRDLRERNFRFTTGNLCTRYLFDMLAKYGYIDDAWKLMTNETYPSIGYMIQNEATTVWERFELKKDPGMNSHNHPMYGAAGYFFYAYIAGIVPTAAGYDKVRIKPYFPTQLESAHAVVDTVKGDISVRWSKRYGRTHLFVDIPFGVTADVDFGGKVTTVGSGYHVFEA